MGSLYLWLGVLDLISNINYFGIYKHNFMVYLSHLQSFEDIVFRKAC